MTAAASLRRLLSSGDTILVPGAYNALVARVLEQSGFAAIYTGGYGAAAATYGLPDIGIMTGTEMADHVSRIGRAVSVPIIADADTGYGELVNVGRTVREFERAGAAAIQIEDQVFPKRCGHMEGKRVIPRDEMVKKVRAALAARSNPDTVIIARTDAIAVTGVDDAIDRMQAYAEAGADVIFPDAPNSTDEMRSIAGRNRPAARREHVRVWQDPAAVQGRDRGARLRDRAVSVVDALRRGPLGPRDSGTPRTGRDDAQRARQDHGVR